MKTKDRIIEASCALFNSQGERAVTTNHIAAYLGISPGNLYYHFRNKEQIIRAIFSWYEAYLEEGFAPVDTDDARSLMERYLEKLFKGMWQFRFLYASLADILARDKELHKRYLEAHERNLQQALETTRHLKRLGILTVEDQYEKAFTEGMKMIVTHWISNLYIKNLDGEITESMVYQGVLMLLELFSGYIAEPAKPMFEEIMAHYRALAQGQDSVKS
ncbi:TetR/AcrR family transcriptional regulator [Ferrimonas pelagia]|uniref:TetR/AcrR family transcriptional regulator n=1 Tax=Ferrimonas pelagia TaxID=1177826 RepID=A0ABP9F6E8_9GAMM